MKANNTPVIVLVILTLFCLVYAFAHPRQSKLGVLGFIAPNTREDAVNTFSPFLQFKRVQEVRIPILMYHYVEYNRDKNDYLRDSLNIQPHVFEEQIITLKQAGYTFVTPAEIYGSNNIKTSKPIILTFDDGYADFYTDVFPILKKHNAKAISYIVFNFIGRQNYMTQQQINEISKSGLVEFGSHTMNHAWLPGSNIENIEHELTQSKSSLEQLLGVSVVSFAYPYGVSDAEVTNLVKKAGYLNAVTTEQGISLHKNEAHTLKRLRPGYNTGADLLYILGK